MGIQVSTPVTAEAEVKKYTLVGDDIYIKRYDASTMPAWYKQLIEDIIANSGTITDINSLINYLKTLSDGYSFEIAGLKNADGVMNSTLESLSSSLGSAQAAIATLNVTKVDADSAEAISNFVVGAYFDNNAGAWFDQKISTYASAIEANASNYSTLAASLAGQTARIDSMEYVSVGLDGYALGASKLGVAPDGSITGWQFMDGTGQQSSFKILADSFTVSDGTSAIAPFEVANGEVNINGVLNVNKQLSPMYLGEFASAPTSPLNVGIFANYYIKSGDTYKNTTNGVIYTYTGGVWTSLQGANAKIITLSTSAEVFKKSVTGVFSPSTITVAAYPQNTVVTQWRYSTNGGSTWTTLVTGSEPAGVVLSGNTVLLTGSTLATESIVLEANDGTVKDTLTIVKLSDGSNGITVVVANEAHIIPCNSAGTPTSYSGSGTTIRVYEGATELNYDGVGTSTGMWTVSASGSGIVSGSVSDSGVYATVNQHSSMSTNPASVSLTISGRRLDGTAFTVTKMQTLTKSIAGVNGTNGTNGTNGARGAGWFNKTTTLSAWSDAEADSAITSLGLTKVLMDKVTLSKTTDPKWSVTKYWSGSAWIDAAMYVDGNMVVSGTILADKIAANQITIGKIPYQELIYHDMRTGGGQSFYDNGAWRNQIRQSFTIPSNFVDGAQANIRFVCLCSNSDTGNNRKMQLRMSITRLRSGTTFYVFPSYGSGPVTYDVTIEDASTGTKGVRNVNIEELVGVKGGDEITVTIDALAISGYTYLAVDRIVAIIEAYNKTGA